MLTITPAYLEKTINVNSAAQPHEDQNKSDDLYRQELAIAILKEMKRECISNGAKLLIFDIPIRLSRTQFESRFLIDEHDAMKHFEVFNPIELFKQHKGEKIYWEKSEGHFTPVGCRIVGKGMAELTLSKNLLNSKSTTFGKDIVH